MPYFRTSSRGGNEDYLSTHGYLTRYGLYLLLPNLRWLSEVNFNSYGLIAIRQCNPCGSGANGLPSH